MSLSPINALLHVLSDEGVDRVFGNPGTTELPIIHALRGTADIHYVLALQEASAVAMADGYARATQRPAFVNLHVAAGLANGMVGLLNASRSRTPLVVTAGQQDRRHLAQDPMLSGDLVAMARPVVKHAFDVQHAADLPLLLRRAFATAVRPPAGPVFLSLPMDLLAETEPVQVPKRSLMAPAAAAGSLNEAARLLAAARAPAVVAGDGVGRDDAVADLVAVAEALGAVTYHQPMYDGINFPGTHPLYAGMLPARHADIRRLLADHDVVLIVGCRAFTPHHYTPGPPIPTGTVVVQLDSDPAEPGRNFPVALGLVGGIRRSLRELAQHVNAQRPGCDPPDTTAVRSRIAEARATTDRRARDSYGKAPLDPLAAAHALANGLPAETVVVEEAITTGLRLRSVLRQDRPRSYVHTVGGGLGSGIGMAIGSRLGDPTRPVVAVLGDGCAMFGLQGLWSAARYGVPVTFVVMNNGEYRTLKETHDAMYGPAPDRIPYVGLDIGPPALDFRRAADFFGIDTLRAHSTDELAAVVAEADERDRPLLVDVPLRAHGEDVPDPAAEGADR
nr:thiamine pyrophosphate-binding protein [Micromonospora tarapacensis]